MQFYRKLTIIFIVISLLFGLNLNFTFAASSYQELENSKNQLESIDQKQDQVKDKIKALNQQKSTLAGQAEQIDNRIDSINSQISVIDEDLDATTEKRIVKENQLGKLNSSLNNTIARLEQTKKELAIAQRTLKSRVVNFYKYGGTNNYFEVVLNSRDFSDFINRITYIQIVIQQDNQIVKKINKTKKEITVIKKRVEKNRNQVANATSELLSQEARIESLKKSRVYTQNLAEQELTSKNTLIAKTKKNIAVAAEYEDQLERDSQKLIGVIQSLQSKLSQPTGGSVTGTGQFIWPVNGRISDYFGPRKKHPVTGKPRFHYGIDIAARGGTPIKAADSGTVIYSGWFGGYGKTVIINHGDGISTLYAHASSLIASEGQSVSKGQTVARVGSTGLSTGNHLHFEVRVNGAPKNPLGYL